MSESVITVTNVSKDFRLPQEKAGSIKSMFTSLFKKKNKKNIGMQHALIDVTFEIKKGEFFGIVGRNGSGKSTMLKMLAGIYQPTKGAIQVEGKLVPFIELGVGFNPELTGKQNVYLNGALLGFSEKEIDGQFDDIVEFAELKDFMDQKLKNFSSGMQVRLAFSMAVRAKADVLLIDEVLAVGDADFQRKCFNYFSQLKGSGTTVIFVSHNMSAVREYCDRAMLIEKSKVIEVGSTDSVSEKYLRLFMNEDNTQASSQPDSISRWGDGSAITNSIEVQVQLEKIIIKQELKATVDIKSPIAGFRIRDATGAEITGTNTTVENKPMPDMNINQSVLLTWEMPNILSDGQYTVDPAVVQSDGVTVADWWDGAARFRIKKLRHLPYAIDPSFELLITRETK